MDQPWFRLLSKLVTVVDTVVDSYEAQDLVSLFMKKMCGVSLSFFALYLTTKNLYVDGEMNICSIREFLRDLLLSSFQNVL